jgi:hypothetical protein
MKSLFWIKLDAEIINSTIWDKVEDFTLSKEDIDLLEQQYSSGAAVAATKTEKVNDSEPAPVIAKSVSLLDGKRNQNVLIALGKLRMTPEKICDIISKVLSHIYYISSLK